MSLVESLEHRPQMSERSLVEILEHWPSTYLPCFVLGMVPTVTRAMRAKRTPWQEQHHWTMKQARKLLDCCIFRSKVRMRKVVRRRLKQIAVASHHQLSGNIQRQIP